MSAIAVIGAGAMGAALAVLHHRAGLPTTLLGTKFDDDAVDACAGGRPHPALGVELPRGIDCLRHDAWSDALGRAESAVLAVASDGLADTVAEARSLVTAGVTWVVATKGWDRESLRSPSEVVASLAGARRVVVLAGPALAPEIVAGAPTAFVCASKDPGAARSVADRIRAGGAETEVTDDVAAVEIGAAYKNVTAIAVGMCAGLSDGLPEGVYVHRFADAQGAVFALGLRDMNALAAKQGGRPETILGLAGAGDLYVTCLGGRNGSFGRLIGAGQTPSQALGTIGSTVEGVGNAAAALALAARLGVDLHVARAVDAVLTGTASPQAAIEGAIASLAG